MGLVAGYLASITINAVEYSQFSSTATRSATRNAIDKTKLGQDRNTYLSALGDSTIDASLHLDTTIAAGLEAAYEATDPIAYVFRAGAVGVADAGQYAGNAIITDFSLDGSADGEWDVSLSLQGTGDYTYTAPV